MNQIPLRNSSRAMLLLLALAFVVGSAAAEPDAGDAALTRSVTALAKVGGAYAAYWSPDGKQIAYLTNISGSPQVWVVAAAGGYPRQVTAFDDAATAVAWSPDGKTLAYSLAPGGGLNVQIYFTTPERMGQTRISAGGEVNDCI